MSLMLGSGQRCSYGLYNAAMAKLAKLRQLMQTPEAAITETTAFFPLFFLLETDKVKSIHSYFTSFLFCVGWREHKTLMKIKLYRVNNWVQIWCNTSEPKLLPYNLFPNTHLFFIIIIIIVDIMILLCAYMGLKPKTNLCNQCIVKNSYWKIHLVFALSCATTDLQTLAYVSLSLFLSTIKHSLALTACTALSP